MKRKLVDDVWEGENMVFMTFSTGDIHKKYEKWMDNVYALICVCNHKRYNYFLKMDDYFIPKQICYHICLIWMSRKKVNPSKETRASKCLVVYVFAWQFFVFTFIAFYL